MKIVFMGTPDFARGCLQALYDAGYEIPVVVTQPDRPKGRKKEPMPSEVKVCAIEHSSMVLQPEKIRGDLAVIETLRQVQADLFVVAAFGQILPKEILELPRLGCINVHASLLPKYRGAAPIQQAILDGESVSGVTIMQMAEGLDTGDILTTCEYPISDEETGGSLFDALMQAGAELLVKTIPLLENGKITPQKQDDAKASYVKMLKKEDGKLDFSKDARSLFNRIRGLDPWPGAFVRQGEKTLKIWKSRVLEPGDTTEDPSGLLPGQILGVSKEGIDVVCGQGILRILELQPEGKKRMASRDYLLGHSLSKGERFDG